MRRASVSQLSPTGDPHPARPSHTEELRTLSSLPRIQSPHVSYLQPQPEGEKNQLASCSSPFGSTLPPVSEKAAFSLITQALLTLGPERRPGSPCGQSVAHLAFPGRSPTFPGKRPGEMFQSSLGREGPGQLYLLDAEILGVTGSSLTVTESQGIQTEGK